MKRRAWYIIAYDIADPRRLQKVFRVLKSQGLALQRSVFLVRCTTEELNRLLDQMTTHILFKKDDIKAYPVSRPDQILSSHGDPTRLYHGKTQPSLQKKHINKNCSQFTKEFQMCRNGKLPLILDRKGIDIQMDAGSILVRTPGEAPRRFPLHLIDRVIIVGNPTISCHVLRSLSLKCVPLLLISSRGKFSAVHMGHNLPASLTVRTLQYRYALCHPHSLLDMGKWLILKKLNAQITLLKSFSTSPHRHWERIRDILPLISGTFSTQTLMGYEGMSAAIYFQAIAEDLSPKWKFRGRNKRPPMDPVNALLSLSYTLAMGTVKKYLLIYHLDPAFPVLHALESGRDSLVLDLVEPLRPMIDRFVIDLVCNSQIKPSHFTTSLTEGCRLTKEGRNVFYPAWIDYQEDHAGGIDALTRKLAVEFLLRLKSNLPAKSS
jgi:CRISP-associated protein Cas1